MKKLLAIGEALVDIFNNCEVKVGGAPLNVLGANSKLGGNSFFIGKISNDEYGQLIIDTMKMHNIHSDYVTLSNDPTAKAYVTTLENGDREFRFDRHNSADQMLNKNEIEEEWFNDAFSLHFCSVCLDEFPCKDAHIKAIDLARKNGCIS